MPSLPVLVDYSPENLDSLPCCGVKSPAHEGRRLKTCWLARNMPLGLRAKALVTEGGRHSGYIECVPGEHAWRAVDAAGYLFIHCVWTWRKDAQRKGYGRIMLDACLEDARRAGMHGVAAVARDGPWLAGPELFLGNGFEVVDRAPPDYRLVVKKLDSSAPDPKFRGGWESKLKKYSRGLTIIRSDQCPHIAKFARDIAECAEAEHGIKPRMVELKSHCDAQNAPTPYAVFVIVHNGRVLADRQISRTRFRNIMRQLGASR